MLILLDKFENPTFRDGILCLIELSSGIILVSGLGFLSGLGSLLVISLSYLAFSFCFSNRLSYFSFCFHRSSPAVNFLAYFDVPLSFVN